MFRKIRFYISPYFLVRYYLIRDIKYFVSKYKFKGTVLDLGCGEKPYKYLFQHSDYHGIDFQNYSVNKDFEADMPDYFFDEDYKNSLKLPFSDEQFDHAVSFQVLEHHENPEFMVEEITRITKKNGLILLTCPFIGGLHEEPHDFQRLTKYKLARLFEKNNCEILKIKEQGSLFSAISMLLNEQLNHFAAKNKINYCVAIFIYVPLLLFQYICLILDIFIKSKIIFINYLVLARKQ
jgi:SAM-dependent methyltransferase